MKQWTVTLYTKEWYWKTMESYNSQNEYYSTKHEAEQAAKVAEYQGYWTHIFAPDGELS